MHGNANDIGHTPSFSYFLNLKENNLEINQQQYGTAFETHWHSLEQEDLRVLSEKR